MRLQTKIGLILLPLIALGILVLGAWSIKTTTDSIKKSVQGHMRQELDDFVDHTLYSLYNLLKENGLDQIGSFVKTYQHQALEEIQNVHRIMNGDMLILDETGSIISTKNTQGDPSKLWEDLINRSELNKNDVVFGDFDSSEGKEIYSSRYFAPWKWTVVYLISSKEINRTEVKIRNTTIGVAVLCIVGGFVILFFLFKFFFVRPVSYLKEVARDITDLKDVDKINIRTKDELGDLARRMEMMAQSIKESQKKQRNWRRHLEEEIKNRTAELQSSEERYRTMFNNNHAVMLLIDPETEFIEDANPAACEYYGYTYDEFLKLKVSDINTLPREHIAEEMENARLMKRKQFYFKHRLANGEIRDVEVYSGPITFSNKELLFSIVHDITARKIVEDSLKKSESRFKAIFESTTDCVLVWDKDYNYLYANQAAIDYVGTTRDMVVGKNMRDGLGHIPDFMHLWMKRVDTVFETETSLRVEDALQVGDKFAYTESVLSPIKKAQGETFAVGVVYRDVTERKEMAQQINEANELKEKMISASSLGIFVYDEIGQCILANEAATKIVGAPHNKIVAQNCNELESWKKSRLLENARAVMADGKERNIEVYTKTTFGRDLWMKCNLARFKMTGKNHLLLIVDDISERKKLEKELQIMNFELVQSNKELDDFAYIASHDLREPLRGISNYISFIKEDYAEKFDKDGMELLNTLKKLCRREEGLIDSLLEYSRVGRTELAYGNVDLNEVVEDIVDAIKPSFIDQNIRFEIPEPLPVINCDSVRINEVFYNLITNGLKYNDKKEKLIEIGFSENIVKKRKITIFYVRDNGIGIPEKHQERIFKIFKRLHVRDKYGGGSGAGLTIVKKIVERHNGRIWLKSDIGQGTTFYFTLQEANNE